MVGPYDAVVLPSPARWKNEHERRGNSEAEG
jgi:hypothetical protein